MTQWLQYLVTFQFSHIWISRHKSLYFYHPMIHIRFPIAPLGREYTSCKFNGYNNVVMLFAGLYCRISVQMFILIHVSWLLPHTPRTPCPIIWLVCLFDKRSFPRVRCRLCYPQQREISGGFFLDCGRGKIDAISNPGSLTKFFNWVSNIKATCYQWYWCIWCIGAKVH